MPIGLVGYSYGARVITGALHILGGGQLGNLGLDPHTLSERRPVQLVLIAAAMHAHWLAPDQFHGNAMSQVDRLLLINNKRDLVMRWYHMSTKHGKPQALGLRGPTCIGPERARICIRDVSSNIGPRHELCRYLTTPGISRQLWQYTVWER